MDIYDRGLRLRELRQKLGFTQDYVAQRLDLVRETISAYERNIKTPSVEILEKLALLYRTSTDYILGLEHRENIYIDDLSKSQQKVVRNIVEMLREEWTSGRR